MEITNKGKHILVDQYDLAKNCMHVPFDDVDMHMFPTVDRMTMARADKVVYRYYIDNPDIPYMTRTLKEKIITNNLGNIVITPELAAFLVNPNTIP